MKPFDLEKALAGAPVVTRDGRKVLEIFAFERLIAAGSSKQPVMALVKGDDSAMKFTVNGHFFSANAASDYDLFMDVEVKFTPLLSTDGVMHLPGGNSLYTTEQEVVLAWGSNEKFVRVVEVHL